MNIKVNRINERYLREMIQKNSRYGSMDAIVNEAVDSFTSKKRNVDLSEF